MMKLNKHTGMKALAFISFFILGWLVINKLYPVTTANIGAGAEGEDKKEDAPADGGGASGGGASGGGGGGEPLAPPIMVVTPPRPTPRLLGEQTSIVSRTPTSGFLSAIQPYVDSANTSSGNTPNVTNTQSTDTVLTTVPSTGTYFPPVSTRGGNTGGFSSQKVGKATILGGGRASWGAGNGGTSNTGTGSGTTRGGTTHNTTNPSIGGGLRGNNNSGIHNNTAVTTRR